jgi:hypothetical protein
MYKSCVSQNILCSCLPISAIQSCLLFAVEVYQTAQKGLAAEPPLRLAWICVLAAAGCRAPPRALSLLHLHLFCLSFLHNISVFFVIYSLRRLIAITIFFTMASSGLVGSNEAAYRSRGYQLEMLDASRKENIIVAVC